LGFAADPTAGWALTGDQLAWVKLGASAARLHGPALFSVWFVSDPRVDSINSLI